MKDILCGNPLDIKLFKINNHGTLFMPFQCNQCLIVVDHLGVIAGGGVVWWLTRSRSM